MDITYKLTNRILAGISFLISFIIYLLTMAPTTSFWDCGEFIATSVIMGVPHPPGTPLFLLIGNLFSQLPTYADIGARVNLISPIASAFAVMLTYLIIVQLIEEWRGKVKSTSDVLIAYGSAFVGAITFAVTDSHWFNAVEAEVYSMSTFFTAIVVWLILRWAQNEGKPGNVKYILIIAYMLGLAIGIHLLNLLALPFVAMIIYYKKYKFSIPSFLVVIGITGAAFIVIYQGIIKGLPFIAKNYGLPAVILAIVHVILATVWVIRKKQDLLATILSSVVLILVGFSTYTIIFIRANQSPAINENNPDTFERAVMYMNREQYGDWSILDRKSTLDRPECSYSNRYTLNKNNPSDKEIFNFVWNYQIKEMYLRYFAWQFIGRGEFNWEVVNLKGKVIKYLEGIDVFRYGLPLAFLLGIAGMLHHFYRDWKRALAMMALFLLTGLLIIIYLNQYDPQPRERDYSYVGSFFAFSIWIGIGIAGLLEQIRDWWRKSGNSQIISIAVLVFLFIVMPVRMTAKDYHEHNRHGNYVAWDYAYNMLNSCEPDGIIFTNGDNDTFPLWYLQEVRGVRKDVRVVNLSLLNTSWYVTQLRDDPPTLPLTMKDGEIQKLMPVPWEKQQVSIRGPQADSPNITWTLKPTYEQRYLRVQDIMIYRIIKDMNWRRPIYFAVTVSPENQIGLNDYLQMEGLVYRLNPEKGKEVNYDRMLKNITQTENMDDLIITADDWTEHMETDDGVYRYRNLNNSKIYFSSNILRLIQNYRSGFLRLTLDNIYSTRPERQEKSYRLLKEMDKYFPPELLPINNPDLEIQVARLFKEAGADDECRDRLDIIRNYPNLSVESQYYIGQMYLTELNDPVSALEIFKPIYDNPKYNQLYEIMFGLVQSYSQLKEYDQAIEILDNWILTHPNDREAKQMLEVLQEELGKKEELLN